MTSDEIVFWTRKNGMFFFSNLFGFLEILPKSRFALATRKRREIVSQYVGEPPLHWLLTSPNIRFSNERLELWETGWTCPLTLGKIGSFIEESNPHWETGSCSFMAYVNWELYSYSFKDIHYQKIDRSNYYLWGLYGNIYIISSIFKVSYFTIKDREDYRKL